MAFPPSVIESIELGKTYLSNLNTDEISDKKNGCIDCGCNKTYTCLFQILFALDYKSSIGVYDDTSKALYIQMLEIIGANDVTDAILAYYGAFNKVVSTEAEAISLTQSLYPNFELNTGTTQRFFNIVLRQSINIVSILDEDVPIGNNITSEYLLSGTVTIEGDVFRVYALELAIPYSTNHQHNVTTDGI